MFAFFVLVVLVTSLHFTFPTYFWHFCFLILHWCFLFHWHYSFNSSFSIFDLWSLGFRLHKHFLFFFLQGNHEKFQCRGKDSPSYFEKECASCPFELHDSLHVSFSNLLCSCSLTFMDFLDSCYYWWMLQCILDITVSGTICNPMLN